MGRRRGIIAALCMAYANIMVAQKKEREAKLNVVADPGPMPTFTVRQGSTGSMLSLYMRDGHSLDVYYGGRMVRLSPDQIMNALEGK